MSRGRQAGLPMEDREAIKVFANHRRRCNIGQQSLLCGCSSQPLLTFPSCFTARKNFRYPMRVSLCGFNSLTDGDLAIKQAVNYANGKLSEATSIRRIATISPSTKLAHHPRCFSQIGRYAQFLLLNVRGLTKIPPASSALNWKLTSPKR